MSTIGTRATNVKKEDIEGCELNKISITIKDKTIDLYDSQRLNLIRDIYVITNNRGQKIKVFSLRNLVNKCKDDIGHSIYSFANDNYKTSDRERMVFYKQIPENLSDFTFLDYFFLPFDSAAKNYNINFFSCRKNLFYKIAVFPDIEYSLTFGIDFGNVDSKVKKQKISAKFQAAYNDKNYRTKKAFNITSEKVEPEASPDLKNKIGGFQKLFQAFDLLLGGEELLSKIKLPTAPSSSKAVFKKPNISAEIKWSYAISEDYFTIGRKISLKFQADPLIGIEWSLNLLEVGVNLVSPGLGTLLQAILDFTKESLYIEFKLYVKGTISLSIDGSINTAAKPKDSMVINNPQANAKLAIELVASAKVNVDVLFFEFGIEGSIKGVASVTLNSEFEIKEAGLYADLSLNFDGLKVVTKIVIVTGTKTKKQTYSDESEFVVFEKIEDIIEFNKGQPYHIMKF